MDKIQACIQHAERQCRKNGVRLTTKRKQILLSLLQAKKAMSAYELVDHYKNEQGESMPVMSVYRILNFLENEFLVHKLLF